MTNNAVAEGPSRSFIVHTSTSQIGGAEASLLELFHNASETPFFILPGEGALCQALSQRGISYKILPWPKGLAKMTQSNWMALPLVLITLFPYLLRLKRETAFSQTILSSGFKSHCTCLLLSAWMGPRLLFDIRDFLRPKWIRKGFACASRLFGNRIRTNSKRVGSDYPESQFVYPIVKTHREVVFKRGQTGKRVIAHLAFFAPYKGQDLFLDCVKTLVDAGLDAEFWMIGDVIYPAKFYSEYGKKILEKIEKLGLVNHVKMLGRIHGGENIQSLLEQVDLLLHCTREPEPYGRAVMEALLCGCQVICHRESGVCEVAQVSLDFPAWVNPIKALLGPNYIQLHLNEIKI